MTQASQALSNSTQNQFLYLQNAVNLIGPLVALWLFSRWAGGLAMAGLAAFSLSEADAVCASASASMRSFWR